MNGKMYTTPLGAGVLPGITCDTIGGGKRGPVTTKLQDLFFKYINAEVKDTHNRLTFIE